MSYYVYIHTCKDNGKKYVGCTKQARPELRWKEGNGYWYNKHFYSSILKYGWTNFEHEVFEVDSEEEMYRKEVELISFYHSNDPRYGYNYSVGGEHGYLGCRHSEEARKKMSQAKKGRVLNEEHRRKISETLKKRCSDPEVRKHRSEVRKGKPHKPFSEEARKHMAEAAKERAKDPEYLKKLSEAGKGKPKPKVKIKLPDGTILEMCKSLLTRWYLNKGKKFEYVD